jgi:prolyl-tRNA synthetase
MRMSMLFGQTLRETPAAADVAGHALLLRAGYIRPLGAGIFSLLPLGLRVIQRIAGIMREEMNRIGGQELLMPVVHPADIWQESGSYQEIGFEMGRFADRAGHPMVLAMTHEEIVADLVRREIRSYRQLPRLVYHIQTKWRDDPRPRAGLIRTREFTMLDSYSLDVDEAGLDTQYRRHYQAYFDIFGRCDLPVIAVQADVDGRPLAHDTLAMGEDTFCAARRAAAANRQVARQKTIRLEALLPLERVATPHCATIEDLAGFLGVRKSRTAKAVFFTALSDERDASSGRLVLALVRGDVEVNETKLVNALGARALRPATEAEIRAVGAEPGYASGIGLHGAVIVADDGLAASPNLIAGANEDGYHLRNVNLGRDFAAEIVTDIAAAGEGSACPQCGTSMEAVRGVEVGNIFKLGTHYSEKLGCEFLDAQGQSRRGGLVRYRAGAADGVRRRGSS